MSAILGFRTITKIFMHHYVLEGTPAALTPKPIAIIIPPTTADIDPGISLGEVKSRTCKGPMQTVLTFKEETNPTLQLAFDLGGPEIESMIHGKVIKRLPSVETAVLFEIEANATNFPGRQVGEHGYQVQAQPANSPNAMAYYIDPQSKMAVNLAIVAASPTGNEIAIDEHLEITLSSQLATTGYRIQGRVMAPVAQGTVVSNTDMGLVGVFLSGVYHDGSVREFRSRYCSLQYGTSLTADGKRQVNLRILPDPESISGLGWDIVDVPLQMAC